MFEVKIMVDDKKLTKLLWALDGLIAGQPQLLPVRGAKVVRSSTGDTNVRALKGVREGTIFDRFTKLIMDHPGTEVQHKTLKAMMVQAGGKPNSVNHAIYRLKQVGLLKGHGRGNLTINVSV